MVKKPEMTTVGAAIMGAGDEAARIARGYADAGIPIKAVWSTDSEKGGALAESVGAKAVESPAQILDDRSIDAVEICTPLQRRASDAVSALKAGKYVSVRGPVAATVAEAKELMIEVTLAGDRFRYLVPEHHHAPHALARKLVRNDEVGLVNNVTIRVSAADAGPFLASTITEPLDRLQLAQWFCGPVAEVETIRHESSSVSILRFEKPHLFGNFDAVWSPDLVVPFAERPWYEVIELTGLAGIVWVNGFWGAVADRPPVVMRRFKRMVNFGADLMVDPRSAYKRAANVFAGSVAKGEYPRPNIDEAIADLKLLKAAARSAEVGGRVKVE